MHPWFPERCWKGTWSKCDLNVARRSWRKQASGLFLAFRFCVSLIFTWSEILVKQVTTVVKIRVHTGNGLTLLPPLPLFSCCTTEASALLRFFSWLFSWICFFCLCCQAASSSVIFSRSVSFIFWMVSLSSLSSFQCDTKHFTVVLDLKADSQGW